MKERTGWRALARYLAGESSPQEAEQVLRWAETDPRHAELLESARRSWEAPQFEEPPVNVDAAWRDLSARIVTPTKAPPAIGRRASVFTRPRFWVPMLAAAALSLLVVPVVRRQLFDAPAGLTYSTGPGQQLTVRFEDGSVARLAPNSRLRAAPNGAREAWLEGTAFFGIAERNGQPFVVHTASGDARVLGTRFELRVEEGRVRLAVLEGKVELVGPAGQELVTAGNVSQAERGDPPTAPQTANVHELLTWMGDVLIFQDTPLGDAAQEIERKYHIPVRIADAALRERTLTALFDQQSLDTVITTVCRVVDATCQVQDSVVVVRP
jgi:transmembrane sensor